MDYYNENGNDGGDDVKMGMMNQVCWPQSHAVMELHKSVCVCVCMCV